MNANAEQLQQIANLFSAETTQVLIALPPQAKPDECAAALAWAEVVRSLGKECKVVAPSAPKAESTGVPGIEEITQELGGDNLVVSFPYEQSRVDKVSYHIGEQTGRFYLTIKPKPGVKPLDVDKVELGYAGASANVLIYIGVTTLDQLEPYASEYADLFRNTPSISLVRNGEAEVGTLKLQCEGAASLSEESAHLFMQLGWEVPVTAATALLRGIEFSSDWLASTTTTANTFEAVAALLRAGARRLRKPIETPVLAASAKPSQTGSRNVASAIGPSTPGGAIPTSPQSSSPYQPISLADAMRQRQNEWGMVPNNPTSAPAQPSAQVHPATSRSSVSTESTSNNPQPTSEVQTSRHHRRRHHQVVTGYPGRKKTVS